MSAIIPVGLVALGAGVAQAALMIGLSRPVHQLVQRRLATEADSQSYLVEALNGIGTIKATGAEATVFGQPAKCGGSTLAEGIAVKNVTERTVAICRQFVDDVRLVGEADIERAVMAYLTHQKTLAEGAGAAGLAAVLADPNHFQGRKVGLVLCGGNIDPRILSSVITRELQREMRIVNLRITIDDRPGVLGKISSLLGQHGANILEVSHRRMFLDIPAKGAELEIMIETRDKPHAEDIVRLIEAQGFTTRVLDAPGGRELR